MNKVIKLYPATSIAFILSVVLFVFSTVLNLDVFEIFISVLEDMEHLELDEVIFPLFILMVGVGIDIYRKYIQKRDEVLIAETKLESLKTVMRTVQDVVGNAMNNIFLYTYEAKETGTLSDESINEIEMVVQETTAKINDLANLEIIKEREIGDNMYIIDVDSDHDKKA